MFSLKKHYKVIFVEKLLFLRVIQHLNFEFSLFFYVFFWSMIFVIGVNLSIMNQLNALHPLRSTVCRCRSRFNIWVTQTWLIFSSLPLCIPLISHTYKKVCCLLDVVYTYTVHKRKSCWVIVKKDLFLIGCIFLWHSSIFDVK